MNITIRIADERDWDAIARLNHDTYALELGQYEPAENGRKTDRLHQTNIYLVAYADDELAGMMAITLPNQAEFSTLKRVPVLDAALHENMDKTAEMRLLAIKPAYRGQGIYERLMLAVMRYCEGAGIERVLISAIQNRVPLYAFMGFQAVAEPVTEGAAVYLPMIITRASFDASPFRQKLSRLESDLAAARENLVIELA
jgi:GNAT superfamily N-acetyltransferase